MSIILQEADVPDQLPLNETVARLRKDAELMKSVRGKKNTENEKHFTEVANFLEMLAKRVKKNGHAPEARADDPGIRSPESSDQA